jgi:hypothetical protein
LKDWRAMAKARGLDIPDRDFDRIAGPLDALEESFRPLAKQLNAADEPCVAFRVEEDA